LLDGGADPNNANALSVAVRSKRTDIVRLLFDCGVPVNAIDFESVCYSCDPELIQLFLDRGADPITGYPIYCGFQNCLNPIIAVYKANIDKVPALQLQADMALCYFAKKGNLRCVSLLLWAGARPDVRIPEDDSNNEFSDSCALEEAVRAGHLNVLKRMQPDKYPERLPGLLQATFLDSAPDILEYLLTLLPELSSLPDSGSAILERVLWQMGWAADPKSVFGTRSTDKIDASIDAIELLLRHGAKWKLETVSDARRHFRHLEPARILRVFTILKEHQAAEIPFLQSLVGMPAMRAHLGDFSKKVAHLFHPAPAKPPEPPASKPEPPPEPPRASIAELKTRAEDFILGLIRNRPAFNFWKTELWESWTMPESAAPWACRKRTSGPVTKSSKPQLKSKEWDDLCNEIWTSSESDDPRRITDPALKLLSWVKEHSSPDDWVKDRTLSWHAGLHGRERLCWGLCKGTPQKNRTLFLLRGERATLEPGKENIRFGFRKRFRSPTLWRRNRFPRA
jgi:hypothetical protein